MRILIIANDSLARAGLAAILAQQPGLTVVGQAACADDLPAALAAFLPECVLWDVGWNPAQVLETLTAFVAHSPPTVALLGREEEAATVWATGVRGLLRREATGEQLAAALTTVVQGLVVGDPLLLSIPPPVSPALPQELVEPLSQRELEVLRLLADGLSNKQIARQLAISEHTVKFHINAILGKLGVQSRTEAVVRATRIGLVML